MWADVQPSVALVSRRRLQHLHGHSSSRSLSRSPVSDSRALAILSAGLHPRVDALRTPVSMWRVSSNVVCFTVNFAHGFWAFAVHELVHLHHSLASALPRLLLPLPLLELGPDEVGTSPKSAKVHSAKMGETALSISSRGRTGRSGRSSSSQDKAVNDPTFPCTGTVPSSMAAKDLFSL